MIQFRTMSIKQMDTLLAFRHQAIRLLTTAKGDDVWNFYQDYRTFLLRVDRVPERSGDYDTDYRHLQCLQYAYNLTT